MFAATGDASSNDRGSICIEMVSGKLYRHKELEKSEVRDVLGTTATVSEREAEKCGNSISIGHEGTKVTQTYMVLPDRMRNPNVEGRITVFLREKVWMAS